MKNSRFIHYIQLENRGLFLQKIKVFFLKKIEVFFFANRPLQGFNPSTRVYWKIRVGRMTYDKSLRRGHDRTCVSRGHGTSQKMTSFSRGQARTVRGHGHMYSLRTYTVRNETKNKKTRIGATIGKCSCVFHCTKVLINQTNILCGKDTRPSKNFWLASICFVTCFSADAMPARTQKGYKKHIDPSKWTLWKKHEKTYQNDFKFQFIKKKL